MLRVGMMPGRIKEVENNKAITLKDIIESYSNLSAVRDQPHRFEFTIVVDGGSLYHHTSLDGFSWDQVHIPANQNVTVYFSHKMRAVCGVTDNNKKG